MKQHSNINMLQYAFLKLLQDDLMANGKLSDNLVSILYNSFDYAKKNIKAFKDMFSKPINTPFGPKESASPRSSTAKSTIDKNIG